MRIPSIAAALFSASWALISAPSPASAERVCIAITGQVDYVQDALGVMSGDIAPGVHFTGAYVYESTTPDAEPAATVGDYFHTTAPFGITVNAGGIVFRTDPAHVDFQMEMVNDHPGDNYLLRSRFNLFEKTVPTEERTEIFWQLDDLTETALGNTALTTEPPVLTDWPSFNFLFISSDGGTHDGLFIAGHVTAASKLALDNCAPPAQPGVFHLRGSGANANPIILSLDDNGPTSTTAKYKDSTPVKLAGGNPWKVVGTWVGEPGAAVSMTALRELRVLVGLRNSDDQGTNFDLRAEVLKNGNVIASSADLYCVRGVTRNPNLAKVALLAFDRAPLSFTETDVVSVRILTRIGTDGAGNSCGGHGSATGLRVYFDSTNQDARLRATASAP